MAPYNKSSDQIRFNLTFVRHAETHANAEGIIQGLMDTELSNIGYLQSQALGQYLQYHRFTHIYSSDLKRASETTHQIHSLNRISSCEVQYDQLLRERMYGIAQGRTRQWLRELAKDSGILYSNFTPPGGESTAKVRERTVAFFQKLCDELLQRHRDNTMVPYSKATDTSYSLVPTQNQQRLPRSISFQNLNSSKQEIIDLKCNHTSSLENIRATLATDTMKNTSCHSSIDSALDLSSVSSDQQSVASSLSLISRNSSFEKSRNMFNDSLQSPYKNDFSDIEILVVSHGAVIREFIKYFVCDLQTDIGEHLDTIQDIPPNTSITRFEVSYTVNEGSNPAIAVELVDYHNKRHLIYASNDEYNLDVVNKCSL